MQSLAFVAEGACIANKPEEGCGDEPKNGADDEDMRELKLRPMVAGNGKDARGDDRADGTAKPAQRGSECIHLRTTATRDRIAKDCVEGGLLNAAAHASEELGCQQHLV